MDIVASNNLSVVSQDSGPKAPHKFKVGTGDRFFKPEMDTGSGAFLALSGLVGLNLSMCSSEYWVHIPHLTAAGRVSHTVEVQRARPALFSMRTRSVTLQQPPTPLRSVIYSTNSSQGWRVPLSRAWPGLTCPESLTCIQPQSEGRKKERCELSVCGVSLPAIRWKQREESCIGRRNREAEAGIGSLN
jgi:hypothetical protein